MDAFLLRAPAGDARDGIAHRESSARAWIDAVAVAAASMASPFSMPVRGGSCRVSLALSATICTGPDRLPWDAASAVSAVRFSALPGTNRLPTAHGQEHGQLRVLGSVNFAMVRGSCLSHTRAHENQ